jgi:hypothetical protein
MPVVPRHGEAGNLHHGLHAGSAAVHVNGILSLYMPHH